MDTNILIAHTELGKVRDCGDCFAAVRKRFLLECVCPRGGSSSKPILAHSCCMQPPNTCTTPQPRKTTFANPSPDHVFGISMPPDAEGAKAVTLQWREHQPNPHAKPGPDFTAMNRLAVDRCV